MKRNYQEISLEYLKSLLSKIYGEDIISKNFGKTKQKKRPELKEAKKALLPLWAYKVNKEDKDYYVSTRILNSYPLKFKKIKENHKYKEEDEKIEEINQNKQNSFDKGTISDDTDDTDSKPKSQKKIPRIKLPSFKFSQIKVPSIKVPNKFIKIFKNGANKKNELTPKALMIYIHGGGFLNTSFFFHENYLRDICNKIKIPILGINYAGAPEHPYPEGINDCFQAYMWILDNCESEFGFKPEKIILSGDSSGGNFALCLNFLLISMNLFEGKNIHTPDFLFPLYPCSNCSKRNMSLSLASSFEDFRITIKGLREINESYRGYYPNELDPFINPRDAPDILLKHMPKTRFMTGSHDPLRDDCVRLIYKLCNVGVDVKAYDFFNYQHGFINVKNPIIKGPSRHIFVKEINEFLQQ